MSASRIGLALAALALVAAAPAAAQTSNAHFGPHLSYNFDAEKLGVGVQAGFPIQRRLEFYPSADIYFVDHGSLWAFNGDVKYRASSAPHMQWLYLGTGLNLTHASANGNGNTNAGLNLIAGYESLKHWVHPFAEGRLTLSDNTSFQLAAGLNFTLGQHK